MAGHGRHAILSLFKDNHALLLPFSPGDSAQVGVMKAGVKSSAFTTVIPDTGMMAGLSGTFVLYCSRLEFSGGLDSGKGSLEQSSGPELGFLLRSNYSGLHLCQDSFCVLKPRPQQQDRIRKIIISQLLITDASKNQ